MVVYIIIFVILVIVLGVFSNTLVIKYPKSKSIMQIIFGIAIIILIYLIWESIQKPIRFNKEKDERELATIDKLKDIRTIQIMYKDKYGKFTGNFDTLISFLKNDSIAIPKKDYLPGWDPDTYTEKQGIKLGLIKVETAYKYVYDSLKNHLSTNDIEQLRYIPYTDRAEFVMGASEVLTGSKVKVKVFEVYALYDTLLNGLDEQLVINYIDEREKIVKFPGLKIGSLKEATNNTGNWEF
jgi:effector-binding domain-containing protein